VIKHHEVIGRLDAVEKSLDSEKTEHRADVNMLNDKVTVLERIIVEKDIQIKVLKDDNERLKRIINNDSSNSSLPPSSDQNGKSANKYNARIKSEKKPGDQKGHKGTTLTKIDAEEKLKSGNFKHHIVHIGKVSSQYVERLKNNGAIEKKNRKVCE